MKRRGTYRFLLNIAKRSLPNRRVETLINIRFIAHPA
jgi:hypothetical protein